MSVWLLLFMALQVDAPADASATPAAPQADPTNPKEAQEVAPVDALPDVLPPLDEGVFAPAPPVSAFAQGRLRAGLEGGRDLRSASANGAAVLTGRVGVRGSVGDVDATVVLGEGGTLLAPNGAGLSPLDASFGPRLTTPTFAPLIHEVLLQVPTSAFGASARFSLGRMPVIVADGRFLGVEGFDPRGRFLDGARLEIGDDTIAGQAGAFFLPGSLASGTVLLAVHAVPTGLIPDLVIDGYAWATRDAGGNRALWVPFIGTRLQWSLPWLRLRAGGDLQWVLDETDALAARGGGLHLEAAARAMLPAEWVEPTPFVELGVEGTGGDDVDGAMFRAPAPTQHGALGVLDLVAADNTLSPWLALGAEQDGFVAELVTRQVQMLDPKKRWYGPDRSVVLDADRARAGASFVEIDAHLALPFGKTAQTASLDLVYGLALPGGALASEDGVVAHRLLCSLLFALDSASAEAARPPLSP